MKLQLAGLLSVALMTGRVCCFGQNYSVTDLGVVAGDNQSLAGGLNAVGQATGTSSQTSNPTDSAVATLFSSGQAESLGTLGASDESFGNAINGSGEVAGYHCPTNSQVPPVICRAFLFSNGIMTDIHSESLFPSGSNALGINDSGVVVGYGWPNVNSEHAFFFTNGTMTDLGTLGGSASLAYAINSAGQIVGWSTTAAGAQHAFLHSNGQMIDLGVLGGTSGGRASAISASGKIAGTFDTSGPRHIAQFSNGAWTDLGTGVAGTVNPYVNGINDSGMIVGNATIPGFFISKKNHKPAIPIGYIFRGGAFVDLNTLIPANSGFAIRGAFSINNLGQILCNAINSSGLYHAVLLIPQ